MFPMTLTLTIQSATQLTALAAIAGQGAELAGAVLAADATAKAQASAKTPTKAQTAAAKTKVEAGEPLTAGEAVAALHGHAVPEPKAEAPAAPAQPAPAADSTVVTYEEAAAMVTKVSRTKGRDAAVAVLAQFKATRLSDLGPESFADVIVACGKALA